MFMEFTEEQLKYINSSINKHTFLEACPGSGKTEVVSAKVAKEISSWDKYPGGIAILSFTNSATDELTHRISTHLLQAKVMFPHTLGTFDSFIYKNIVSPLVTELTKYIGEGNDSSIKIIDTSVTLGYRTKYSYAKRGNIYAHHFSFDMKNDGIIFNTGDPITDKALSKLTLTDWQIKDFQDTKLKMFQGGFATYKDIEYLAIMAVNDLKFKQYFELLVKRYPLIIIDECQDLSEEQLTILQALANNGAILHFVGDLHQAIYGFRDVEPIKVTEFVTNNDFLHLKLTRNFRSCQNIINVCAKITGRSDIIGNISWLEQRCIVMQYEVCPTELVSSFDKIFSQFENNVILSRGHAILQKFQTNIEKLNNIQKLALSIKLFDVDDPDNLNTSIQLFSEFISHHLKESYRPNSFNCPQSISSNLIWRKFLCASLNYLVNNDLKTMNISWSVWTKRTKQLIHSLSKQEFCSDLIAKSISSLDDVKLVSPSGLSEEEVTTTLGTAFKPMISYRKSTIHGAKGETHDVTVVISSPQAGNDSNWLNWIKSPDTESARFAYVASSRPKHYLIWAVKKLKEAEKDKLKNIGFFIH
ncbi:TPA: ATP-dependent helicase [Aeromonas hydrophila]|nr:ATP-dependent helicase [Aeromonas hydrophila]HDX8634525.1 ATP-dependent helicase [Aeromonas hydrophila]